MWLSSFQVAGGPPARSSLNSLADGVAALQMFRPDIVDGAIAPLAFNLRIEPADLRNPVITVFPDEPGERDHATGISGDGCSSSLNAETAAEDIDAPEG